MMVTHLVWIHSSQPWSEMVSLHQEMHLQPHGAETSKHFCYQCLSTTCWSSDPVSCQYQQDPLPNVPAGPFIQNSMVSHDSSRATKPKPPTQPYQKPSTNVLPQPATACRATAPVLPPKKASRGSRDFTTS